MDQLKILCLLFLIIGNTHVGRATAATDTRSQGDTVSDVRILIDLSGSMKHNDPANLRAPALRMLTGLLQNGSVAGVWMYGQYVNMAVAHGPVNNEWKDKARRAAEEIHSKGLFTNIEDALKTATRDWGKADPHYQRSLIMLTDGFVDISKDPAESKASRDRIVKEILPKLKNSGVKIHTIALSSDADKALLRNLASTTDGWYEETNTAESLQRVFLRIFEKATRPDTLPLVDNIVQVDDTIEEMTFLIFRKKNTTPTRLVAPDNSHFGEDNPPANARWYHDTGYDLVTIDKPARGSWRVIGDADEGNRVVVVTNLRLNATELPNNISRDEVQHMFVRLTQQGAVITEKVLLDLTDITLYQNKDGGEEWHWTMKDDGAGADQVGGDGIFSLKLLESLQEGKHEFVLNVVGKTFQREQRQTVNVRSVPVSATVTRSKTDTKNYILSVVPYAGLIDPDSMSVSATVSSESSVGRELTLSRTGPSEWTLEVADLNPEISYQAEFMVQGRQLGGKPVDALIGPVKFQGDKVEVSASEPTPATEAKEAPSSASTDASSTETPQAETGLDWFQIAWQVMLLNALFIGIGFFIYKKWGGHAKLPVAAKLDSIPS